MSPPRALVRGSSHREQTGGDLSAGRACQGRDAQGTNCCPGRSQRVPGSWMCVGRAAGGDRPGGGANKPQDTPPSCQTINSFIWVVSALCSASLPKREARRSCGSQPVLSLWLAGWATKVLPCLQEGGDERWGGLDGSLTLPVHCPVQHNIPSVLKRLEILIPK